MVKLRTYRDESEFRNEDGSLKPEPEQTLEELDAKGDRLMELLSDVNARMDKISDDATLYDLSDEEFNLFIASENISAMLDEIDWLIDLKLLHLHYREAGAQEDDSNDEQ